MKGVECVWCNGQGRSVHGHVVLAVSEWQVGLVIRLTLEVLKSLEAPRDARIMGGECVSVSHRGLWLLTFG